MDVDLFDFIPRGRGNWSVARGQGGAFGRGPFGPVVVRPSFSNIHARNWFSRRYKGGRCPTAHKLVNSMTSAFFIFYFLLLIKPFFIGPTAFSEVNKAIFFLFLCLAGARPTLTSALNLCPFVSWLNSFLLLEKKTLVEMKEVLYFYKGNFPSKI